LSKETNPIFLLVVTGFSGAGKTQALRALEDIGYFCVDNLPPNLVPPLVNMLLSEEVDITRVALVMDVRGRRYFESLPETLNFLQNQNVELEILFLEATEDILVRRYKETRRRHPLSPYGSILEGILAEKKILEELRGRATRIIDTSNLAPQQLRQEIQDLYGKGGGGVLTISLVSFGYKYGIPLDADLVFDVRFLPNPFYIPELKELNGYDDKVKTYVFSNPPTEGFLSRFYDFINYLIPYYQREGKSYLVVAIGCTGGKHRSVALVEKIKENLERNYTVYAKHRDLKRE
jgi:UPF0042 nucleotide-binding protein